MKSLFLSIVALAVVGSSSATQVGDAYEQVISEKGKPSSEAKAGDVRILNYPDASIRVKENLVIAVKTREEARGTAIHVTARPAPVSAAATAAARPAAGRRTAEAPLDWTVDYAAALERAKAENRNVFLFFTGSDWCGWCKRLDAEILSTSEFNRFAQEHLILVKLDFPQQIPQTNQLRAQNTQLAKKYNVSGFPTVVVLDPSGKAIKRLGYQEGGPSPFIQTLEAL